MAVSRGTENQPRIEFWQRVFGQLSRHDLLLAVVPLLFALALVVAVLTPVPLEGALGGSAVLSGLCVVDAVYLHPPVDFSSDS